MREVPALQIRQNCPKEQQGPHELLGLPIRERVVEQQLRDAGELFSEDRIPKERKRS